MYVELLSDGHSASTEHQGFPLRCAGRQGTEATLARPSRDGEDAFIRHPVGLGPLAQRQLSAGAMRTPISEQDRGEAVHTPCWGTCQAAELLEQAPGLWGTAPDHPLGPASLQMEWSNLALHSNRLPVPCGNDL